MHGMNIKKYPIVYLYLLTYHLSDMETTETLIKRAQSCHCSDKAMTCAWNSCVLFAVVT